MFGSVHAVLGAGQEDGVIGDLVLIILLAREIVVKHAADLVDEITHSIRESGGAELLVEDAGVLHPELVAELLPDGHVGDDVEGAILQTDEDQHAGAITRLFHAFTLEVTDGLVYQTQHSVLTARSDGHSDLGRGHLFCVGTGTGDLLLIDDAEGALEPEAITGAPEGTQCTFGEVHLFSSQR